jgi:hypothetical protein
MSMPQVDVFVDYANCGEDVTIPVQSALPALDYSVRTLCSVLVVLDIQHIEQVYASIVGVCAYDEGGCSITQQNFVDLVYSAITDSGISNWPSSVDALISERIAPIFAWTNFTVAEGVPYLNFNDYLHFFSSQ